MIDTAEEYVGTVSDLVGVRRARMIDMVNDGRGGVRLEFAIPTRGLIGLRNAFLTATHGNGVMGSRLIGYEPWDGPIVSNRTGAAGRLRSRAPPCRTGSPTRKSAASPSSSRRPRSTRG